MEKTLVLLKPSCVQRQLIGEIVNRFERRGLRVAGMKMRSRVSAERFQLHMEESLSSLMCRRSSGM